TARLQKRDCGSPETERVTCCQHSCKTNCERCQVTTKVSVLSKGMAPGPPVPSVCSRRHPAPCCWWSRVPKH
ncbi:hypothetical protein DV515_00012302, partial [Chloebia gouldiae]